MLSLGWVSQMQSSEDMVIVPLAGTDQSALLVSHNILRMMLPAVFNSTTRNLLNLDVLFDVDFPLAAADI